MADVQRQDAESVVRIGYEISYDGRIGQHVLTRVTREDIAFSSAIDYLEMVRDQEVRTRRTGWSTNVC